MKPDELEHKKYIVWLNHEYGWWTPHPFDTLEEAVACENYGATKIITKQVEYYLTEV